MSFKISSCFLMCLASLLFLNINCSDSGSKNREGCCNGNFLLVATVDGVITALDMDSGEKCWSLLLDPEKFLSSSLSELQIYDNGRRVFVVPSLDGGLYKYDGINRVIQPLPVDVDSLITHSAYLDSSTSVIGGKMKIVFGIHRLTGEILYTCKMDGCNTSNVPFPENVIIVEEIIQCINAVDSVKAEKRWHFRVVELKIKLSSQSFINYPTFSNLKENALIPRNLPNYVNIDTFKVSLQNGFAGLINKSSEDFSWMFKATCPITDAWYLKDDMLQILDPFAKETGFFTVDTKDGKHSAFLFLGLYENQMFIKRSKKFQVRDVDFNSLSTNILFKTYIFPVCPTSQNITAVNDTSTEETDLMPSFMNFNVTDHGFYFYTNFSITENETHCIISTRYIIQYEETNFWPTLYLATICGLLTVGILLLLRALKNFELKKQEVDGMSSLIKEENRCKEENKFADIAEFRSRFHQDFELISVLGKGGFGVVMDVKNKIDDCRYAVKRICLHEKLSNSQYEKVLREVKALAKLDHHGIVRYYNAWTEHPPTGWQEEKDIEFNISDISYTTITSEVENNLEFDNSESTSKLENLVKKFNQNPFKLYEDPFSVLSVPLESDDSSSSIKKESSESSSNDSESSVLFNTISSEETYKINSGSKYSNGDNSIVFDSGSHDVDLDVSEDSDFDIHNKNTASRQSTDKREDNILPAEESEEHSDEDIQLNSGCVEMKDGKNNSSFKNSEGKKFTLMKESENEISRSLSSGKLPFISNEKREFNLMSETDSELTEAHRKNAATNSGTRVSRGYLYIQMQLCQKESLRDWLNQHSVNRDHNKVIEIFYEIVDAVHYVHDCGMMHRDLKPSNIYFSMEGAIKIGDFGLATSSEIEREIDSSNQKLSNIHTSDIGTEFYMSPEQKRKQCYDCKTDIYSLGIIFFELIVPFQTFSERCQTLLKLRQLRFPREFRKTYKTERELVEQLLHEDPKCRPTTNEIKQHPLFLNYTTAHK